MSQAYVCLFVRPLMMVINYARYTLWIIRGGGVKNDWVGKVNIFLSFATFRYAFNHIGSRYLPPSYSSSLPYTLYFSTQKWLSCIGEDDHDSDQDQDFKHTVDMAATALSDNKTPAPFLPKNFSCLLVHSVLQSSHRPRDDEVHFSSTPSRTK